MAARIILFGILILAAKPIQKTMTVIQLLLTHLQFFILHYLSIAISFDS
jgi:hypothetical protein